MEVDFVSFAKLVDSLGGITIDFPNPAIDTNSGLDVKQAGPNELDGAAGAVLRALAPLPDRRRERQVQPIEVASDLGRVLRQQRFLTTVFGEARRAPRTRSRSPGPRGAASGGLRIDDTLGLTDAIRFAWRLRSLDPTPVELPVELGSNSSGSVLFMVEPAADAALAAVPLARRRPTDGGARPIRSRPGPRRTTRGPDRRRRRRRAPSASVKGT